MQKNYLEFAEKNILIQGKQSNITTNKYFKDIINLLLNKFIQYDLKNLINSH